jgi:hypothetical protein
MIEEKKVYVLQDDAACIFTPPEKVVIAEKIGQHVHIIEQEEKLLVIGQVEGSVYLRPEGIKKLYELLKEYFKEEK